MDTGRFGARSRQMAMYLGMLAALGVVSSAHAQARETETQVKAALQVCETWVADADMDGGKALGTASGFVVIGPGGSWFQNDVQAVRFAMGSSGSARDCDVYVLPQTARPDQVTGWVREWMRGQGYVDPHLNGPPTGLLLDARAIGSMSGTLSVMALENGSTAVNLRTLGY